MTALDLPAHEPQLLIVADNLLSRAGLTALLEERGCLVLAAVDGVYLQRDIDQYDPDALVIDLGWNSETMRQVLIQLEPDLPVLALVAAEDDATLAPLLAALRLFPQFALLRRDCQPDALLAALDALAAGLAALDPRLTALLSAPDQEPRQPPPSPLTARENEVLQLLARGLTNRAIALELSISQHTVKFHVNSIMSKLEAQSRTEAVVRATQLGMIAL